MVASQIFKANDIRGTVSGDRPEWGAAEARAIGAAFAVTLDLGGKEFVLGRDMRTSSLELSQAFSEGARSRGASVIDIGLASTDQLWFASGRLGVPGVQFTASHNPAQDNGIKFCLADAAPITPQAMDRIRQLSQRISGFDDPVGAPGDYRELDLLPAYVAKLHSLVDLQPGRALKVVVDAGNGMAGLTAPAVLDGLGLEVIGLYLDLDGSFPNHPPNPLVPANLVDATTAVLEHHADLALVFDGDADRCFFIDEKGRVAEPSVITSLIALAELDAEPAATIVVNTITSRAVKEVVEAAGGQVVTSTVGHTRMKALMAEHNAIFGGEHSAHYYFRDFWSADTGMLAALQVLAMLLKSDQNLSGLVAGIPRYFASGEINSTVTDAAAAIARVETGFAHRGRVEFPDGLLVSGDDWWVSVRESNTEPLLRLNVEAATEETMMELRDQALGLIREEDR